MAYREVSVVEVKEALLLWLGGQAKKAIARQTGLDPKTVRSYIAAAESVGVKRKEGGAGESGAAGLSDELLAKTLEMLKPIGGRPRGDAWALCEQEREEIARLLKQGVRLSKARRLIARRGVAIPYSTLHRFAVEELSFGRAAPTVPVDPANPSLTLGLADTAVDSTCTPLMSTSITLPARVTRTATAARRFGTAVVVAKKWRRVGAFGWVPLEIPTKFLGDAPGTRTVERTTARPGSPPNPKSVVPRPTAEVATVELARTSAFPSPLVDPPAMVEV